MSADAKPFKDFKRKTYSLHGGSGGYIYISTKNEFKNNTLDSKSNVTAQGGYGIGRFSGGSGGVVVFDNEFHMPSINVNVKGGQADIDDYGDGCKNGASGTIWLKKNDTLVIDNKEMNSTAFTRLRVPHAKPLVEDRQQLSKVLLLKNYARAIVIGEHKDMTFEDLLV